MTERNGRRGNAEQRMRGSSREGTVAADVYLDTTATGAPDGAFTGVARSAQKDVGTILFGAADFPGNGFASSDKASAIRGICGRRAPFRPSSPPKSAALRYGRAISIPVLCSLELQQSRRHLRVVAQAKARVFEATCGWTQEDLHA